MFEFHDITQPARVQQFALNLANLKIPPRVAPDFFYKMGYPVFNFYAPTAYWITGMINLLGIDIAGSIQFSFLLCLIFSFIFCYLFLRLFFDFFPSLIGAIFYITSFYFLVDIFVRGNLAETWFITLLPLTFYLLYKNSQKPNILRFVFSIFVFSAAFTSHNLLSIIFIILTVIFSLLLKNKKINILTIVLALLLSSYFFLPVFLESHLIIARQMATQTRYQDHFLCLSQLWDSPWGFGGSAPGCISDGMSFKLGKLQIIFALLGTTFFLSNIFKNKLKRSYILHVTCYMFLLLVCSLFMTTYLAKPIWDLLSPLLAIFQFPWRFLAFGIIGLSFFSAYFWQNISIPYKSFFSLVIVLLIIGVSAKYFQGKTISKNKFINKYLSQDYIEKEAALQIPEYFSRQPEKKINFNYQQPFQLAFNDVVDSNLAVKINQKYQKKLRIPFPTQLWLNINYFPFWEIIVNGKLLRPKIDFSLDLYNRPFIKIEKPASIIITYKQTLVEKIGNLLTLITCFIIGFLIKNKQLWRKLTK